MHADVMDALEQLTPRMSERLLEDFYREVESNPTFPGFADDMGEGLDFMLRPDEGLGSMVQSRASAGGGSLGGPAHIELGIGMRAHDPQTNFSRLPIRGSVTPFEVKLRIESGWMLFARAPTVEAWKVGGPLADEFLGLLLPELEQRGLEPHLRQQLH